MFKSRSIGVDAVQPRSRGTASLNPKKLEERDDGRINVRAMPDYSKRRIPDEYRTLERNKRSGWGVVLFILILASAGAAAYYYLTTRAPSIEGSSVTISVEAPESVTSGTPVTYEVTYKNRDVVAMRTVNLDVQWPDGFYYNTSTIAPVAATATTWNLGPLNPGEERTIGITGQLVGIKAAVLESIFRLSFRPENFSSDFETEQSISIEISDSQLDVSIETPDKVLASQKVPFTATVTNRTSETLKGVVIQLSVPRDLTVFEQNPKLTDGLWKGELEPGKPMIFTLSASVAKDPDGPQSWIVEVKQSADGTERNLLKVEKPIVPVKPDFGIELKIDGESSDFEVPYGKSLSYQLKVTNKSSSAMQDVKITALLDSDVIDRKTVQSTGLVANQSIVWTKDQAEELALMDPGKEVLLSWKADLLPSGTTGRATVDNVITIELEGLADWRQNSSVFVVSVGEGLSFSQQVFWNLGGQQIGSGNLPPVTNERTIYLAVWSLDSGSQDFDTVNLSTTLPDKVTFTKSDDVDEGTLKYDEETKRLEWQINNFSTKLLPLKASFFLKLIPVDDDKGTIMPVINPTTLVASGAKEFQAKSFSVSTAQVVTTQQGDIGTIVE